MTDWTCSFEARLEAGGPSFMPTQVLALPPLALAALGNPLPRRVELTLNGFALRRGLLPQAGGGRYLIISKEQCRAAGVQPGQLVAVQLRPDADPDRVDLPTELQEALECWPEAAAGFAHHPPGMQRAMATHVATAKQAETRARRAVELAERLARGGHPFRKS